MHILKILLCFIFITMVLCANDPKQPNIVFILSDDQGWEDYGFMGHPHIQTPHLDRLASNGILYERGYVTTPLCRPSLASLVSGLYPHQTFIRGNDPVGFRELRQAGDLEGMTRLRDQMAVPMQLLPSFVKELQAGGYATLQTGKWWEGDPLKHGFDVAMSHGDPKRRDRDNGKSKRHPSETGLRTPIFVTHPATIKAFRERW